MLHALRDRESCGLRSQQARVRECLSSSVATLHRLKLEHLLDGHDGCVNTCSWNKSGDLLLSGSDDLKILLWDWQRGEPIAHSSLDGHPGQAGGCARLLVSKVII